MRRAAEGMGHKLRARDSRTLGPEPRAPAESSPSPPLMPMPTAAVTASVARFNYFGFTFRVGAADSGSSGHGCLGYLPRSSLRTSK